MLLLIFIPWSLQLYNDRSKYLKNEMENRLWASLDFNYMTDESEIEDENGETLIHQHPLPWRSQST